MQMLALDLFVLVVAVFVLATALPHGKHSRLA
jgi:hypothetical protein